MNRLKRARAPLKTVPFLIGSLCGVPFTSNPLTRAKPRRECNFTPFHMLRLFYVDSTRRINKAEDYISTYFSRRPTASVAVLLLSGVVFSRFFFIVVVVASHAIKNSRNQKQRVSGEYNQQRDFFGGDRSNSRTYIHRYKVDGLFADVIASVISFDRRMHRTGRLLLNAGSPGGINYRIQPETSPECLYKYEYCVFYSFPTADVQRTFVNNEERMKFANMPLGE